VTASADVSVEDICAVLIDCRGESIICSGQHNNFA
jgi:hypothetical protein